ncbi:MAG TPA: HD domain-containing phosphohydrolase [Thermoanaerobaculia bacterium]|nr:HD domain-containing phosphohydrolase [Thermoanaerobaculia bacterium]
MQPGRTERTPIEQLIVEITAGVNARTLYSPSHPSVAIAAERIANRVDSILAARERESLTFLIVGDELLLDQQPLRDETLFQRHFVQSLKRGDVERLTLARGLSAEECRAFIDSMSTRMTPQSSAHLIVGRVDVAFSGGKDEEGGSDGLSIEQIDRAREAFTRYRADRSVALTQLEEVIAGLVESLSRSTRSMLPLANLKDHDEYTFIHSVNVSIMVMAMGRWHGFPGDQVQSMGMAAMLHDIGKLAVPLEVLNKPGKLEGEEWALMSGHAEKGAWSLAQTPNSPRLAITVAYEHHLRYDGQPNYPILKYPRRPALVSQMTSIADTFDAICTIRPYQKAQSREAALQIIRRRAGTFHDPFLVANFELMLRDIFPQAPAPDAPAIGTL